MARALNFPDSDQDLEGFAALRAALRGDSEETVLAGWTPLGHFELQRKRGRVPLAEVI